jgi:hypothetical protein
MLLSDSFRFHILHGRNIDVKHAIHASKLDPPAKC